MFSVASDTNTIRGFRQVIQDLLVPELRSLKTEMEFVKEEVKGLRAEQKETRELVIRLLEKFDSSLKFAELSERVAKVEQKLNL